jgi:hypothetical protein
MKNKICTIEKTFGESGIFQKNILKYIRKKSSHLKNCHLQDCLCSIRVQQGPEMLSLLAG